MRNAHGRTALHIAATSGYAEVVETMLGEIHEEGERQELLQMVDEEGETAFHRAIRKNNVEVVDRLLLAIQNADKLQELTFAVKLSSKSQDLETPLKEGTLRKLSSRTSLKEGTLKKLSLKTCLWKGAQIQVGRKAGLRRRKG